MGNPFGERLAEAVRRRGTPALVGLDPRWEEIPEPLRVGLAAKVASWGLEDGSELGRRADVYRRFCCGVIDVVAPLVPAVKPQMAFFEELGPAGMQALADVIRYARQHGLLVILDGKRNDIGSTATAYARAYLGPEPPSPPVFASLAIHRDSAVRSPWGANALTVSPYLGDDSLQPFVEVGQQRGAGIFVLVKTSNPGGGQFQDLQCDGRPVYRHVADYVEQLAAAQAGPSGYGDVGAVVGATWPEQLAELRAAMPHAWLLIPGYGSQGGTARDVAAGFDSHGLGAIVNNSRGIIFAHSRPEYAGRFAATDWQRAVEAATVKMIDELRSL